MLENLLMEAAVKSESGFPLAFTLVYVVGFIAAVVGGSIAWYNSKRPAGWEGSERPNIVPKINTDASDDSDKDA
ncbi:photosystem II assembly protein Psb35 [Baaleninema simplex]|uniref:photosystem II assembly protein Psb35 n=1 Tax=Baaleninema simplex TaxID=2862350 RepID=UPI00037FA256|nr:hypothetical protein [Baaleninema simplex]